MIMSKYHAYDLEKVGNLTEDQMQFFVAMQNVEQEEQKEQMSGWQGPKRFSGNFRGKQAIPQL